MALEPNEIEIPLNLGMATKPSTELAAPDAQRLVENLHWRGLGELEKRPTHAVDQVITPAPASTYAERDSCGLIVRGDDLCIITGHHGVATYSPLDGELHYPNRDQGIGGAPAGSKYCPVTYEVSRRFIHAAQQNLSSDGIVAVCGAQHAGIHVVAWIEASSTFANECTVRLKAIDPFTGTTIATMRIVNVDGTTFTATNINAVEYVEPGKEGVLVAFVSGDAAPYTIKAVRYDYATNTFVVEPNLATNVKSRAIALTQNGTKFYLGFVDNTSNFMVIEDRTITGPGTVSGASHDADQGIAIVKGATRTLIVSSTFTTVYAETFLAPGSAVAIMANAEADSFLGVTAALEIVDGSTDDAVMWVNSIVPGPPASDRVRSLRINFVNATPTVVSPESRLPHCRVIANGFTLRQRAHVPITVHRYLSFELGTCFIVRYSQPTNAFANEGIRHDCVARIGHDVFNIPPVLTEDPVRNGVFVDSTSGNAWLALSAHAPVTPINGHRLPQSVMLSRINASRPLPVPYASPAPGVVMVAGGLVWEHDGTQAFECTPLVAPKMRAVLTNAGSQTGNFTFVAVYNFVDDTGRLHRMASLPASTGAITSKRIDLYVAVCPMRSFDGETTAADMEVDLYVAVGSSYEILASGTNKRLYDDVTGDGLWYRYVNVDPSAHLSAPLAIVGGAELPPEPPPAFVHVAKVVDRMWGIDAEDRSRVWFSKPIVADYGVEWTALNTLTIGDECVAVVDQGGGAMILARGGIYLVTGTGPDENGNGVFSPAVKLNHTIECLDPASVCRTPLGVIFRGRRGFYMVNGPDAQPFGVPIDPEVLSDPRHDPSAETSVRMRVIYQEQTNEIQIVGMPQSGMSGHRLVYNLLEQKWSRYVVPYSGAGSAILEGPRDLAIVRGRVWRLCREDDIDRIRDERLFAEDNTDYNTDASTAWRVDTPWYRLADVSGQIRLWRGTVALAVPGDPLDIGTVTVRYYVNNNDTPQMTATWTGAQILASLTFPERVVRLSFMPNVQVVHSFRLEISCTLSGSTVGPKPLSLRLRFGVRPSMSKQNPMPLRG